MIHPFLLIYKMIKIRLLTKNEFCDALFDEK